jgi:pimeloyl-ACP methyl ester carboxylesterase
MAPDDPSDLLTTIDAEDIFDASPELSRIAAPTLVIGGERDRFYTPELFRETAERIPHARLLLYPRKGHAGVMAHRPAIGEVLRFLTADEPPPSGRAPG